VIHVGKGKYHMTMTALELEDVSGRWVLHNAGAPPMMSLGLQGGHKVHFCPGTPLGTEGVFETGQTEGQLEPAERLLIYTDGIPEIALPNGTPMGMRRLAAMYERTRDQGLHAAAASIVQQLEAIQGEKPRDDDWTFTLVEWSGR
jgi:serine phosphatase RsbU (regulator of sigma subunit)